MYYLQTTHEDLHLKSEPSVVRIIRAPGSTDVRLNIPEQLHQKPLCVLTVSQRLYVSCRERIEHGKLNSDRSMCDH
uniref:Uncharacterized protein n=1 Tax=Parascaris univalens TaxID=6257 RepID=A0A915A3J2_PARUN